jgi:hypothetical protein
MTMHASWICCDFDSYERLDGRRINPAKKMSGDAVGKE